MSNEPLKKPSEENYLIEIDKILHDKIVNTFPEDSSLEKIESLICRTRIDTENGCWLRGKDWSAYSSVRIFRPDGTSKVEQAHRVSYNLYTKKIAKEVCHHCDRKGCWNPTHLFGGSHSDNMKDALRKNRIFSVSLATPAKKTLLKRRLELIRERYHV